jgi:hypothetical protein
MAIARAARPKFRLLCKKSTPRLEFALKPFKISNLGVAFVRVPKWGNFGCQSNLRENQVPRTQGGKSGPIAGVRGKRMNLSACVRKRSHLCTAQYEGSGLCPWAPGAAPPGSLMTEQWTLDASGKIGANRQEDLNKRHINCKFYYG